MTARCGFCRAAARKAHAFQTGSAGASASRCDDLPKAGHEELLKPLKVIGFLFVSPQTSVEQANYDEMPVDWNHSCVSPGRSANTVGFVFKIPDRARA